VWTLLQVLNPGLSNGWGAMNYDTLDLIFKLYKISQNSHIWYFELFIAYFSEVQTELSKERR